MSVKNQARDLVSLINEYNEATTMSTGETAERLHRLAHNVIVARQLAPHFDFRDQEYNGIRTILKFTLSLFRVAVKKAGDIHFVTQFRSVVRAMDMWFQAIANDVCIDFTVCSEQQQLDFYSTIFDFEEEAVRMLFGPKFLCLNMKDMRLSASILLRGLMLRHASSVWQAQQVLSLSGKTVARMVAHAMPLVRRSFFASFIRFITLPVVTKISTAVLFPINMDRPVTCKLHKLLVPREHQVTVEWSEKKVSVHSCSGPRVQVKFRILRNRDRSVSRAMSGRVVMYATGGAFMLPSTGAAEMCYLMDLVHEIRDTNAVVLSVCLTTDPFPATIQILLDTYCWLTSGDSRVEKIIGCPLKELVLCGDSSGGNQVLSLLVLMNELGMRVRPHSCVLFFPKTSLQRDIFPSLLLSQFDPFAHKCFLSAACITYLPIVKRLEDGSLVRVPNDADLDPSFVTDASYEMIESVILSPVRYPQLHQLASTSLYLLCMENDPLMDECIQLAKRWHGPVELRVAEQMPHGAMLFHRMTRRARQSLEQAADLIRRAFTDHADQS